MTAAPGPKNVLRCEVGGIVFDQEKGMGNIPFCAEVEYRGFVAMMTPRVFASIAPTLEDPRARSLRGLKDAIAAGKSIAAPYVTVDLQTADLPGIIEHEGRHRMRVIAELLGPDTPVPVCFLLGHHMRAHHITEDTIESIRSLVYRQPRHWHDPFSETVTGPLFDQAFYRGRALDFATETPALRM